MLKSEYPLVSISCITYNHVNYIKDCFDGFLMQKTNFSFEIIICDDASTDGTQQIIEEYSNKYPNVFFPIYQTENQFSKGIKPNWEFNAPRWRGKYIALCEGDDYWVDPLKLQKQVNFLEANPKYILSCHNAKVIDAEGNLISNSKLSNYYKKDFTNEDLILTSQILTLTMCFRNVVSSYSSEFKNVLNGDRLLMSILGLYGMAKYQPEIKPAIYRAHSQSIWSSLEKERQDASHSNTFFNLYKFHLRNNTNKFLVNKLFKRYISFAIKKMKFNFLENNTHEGLKVYFEILFQSLKSFKFKYFYLVSKKCIKYAVLKLDD